MDWSKSMIIDSDDNASAQGSDYDDDYENSNENSKCIFNSTILGDVIDDDMPYRYCHIRSGPRSIRPEYKKWP